MLATILGVLISVTAVAHAAPVTSFDDIEYWIGEGPNQAALVLDWREATGQGGPLAWGYRWDGEATGRDMLLDVIAADERLFGKLDAAEERLYGLGYDFNDPASFGLTTGGEFDERGVTHATQSQADLGAASDPLDAYGEGWYLKFWHYASQPSGFASAWESNQQGFASRDLADGAIDGWTFADVFDFDAFPAAAEPAPGVGLPGDFNNDGRVDAADYTVWRDAGANPNDYLQWRDAYGATNATNSTGAAPEPAATGLLCLFLAGVRLGRSAHLFASGETS